MMKKEKSQMTYNQKKNKTEMNCSMTIMKNMILYLSMIILNQQKKTNSK